MTQKAIEELLAEAVDAYRQIPKNLEVGIAIEAITGCSVIPLDVADKDAELLKLLEQAANRLIKKSKGEPVKTGRLNELGNNIEEPLLNCCNEVGIEATWPVRADGSGGRSGYPDIALVHNQRKTFLEAKVIGAGSEGSSFRSFYMSPSDNPKVCEDARHVLIAFVHNRVADSDDGMEQYELLSFKIVDLSHVCGKIKFEYQSSNKDMYLGKAVVAQG
ncbi:hypothetical protein K3162_02450 [Qipengyuania xiapuensis]|uniref:Uncharacterized protein n=1 Tax=Qipengyuania xiapuensis TaxID=2867236 RepID=A0ABX8ZV94_9SPHN|nr:hypothetical protein [Qipengyuania xiapuensis]QZD92920.1 hypothetical protein K3162_02450 [Qipengyuania xiapuensis]